MIDTNALKKRWNTEPKPKPEKKPKKKPAVKKPAASKKKAPAERPELKKETIPPPSGQGYKPKKRSVDDEYDSGSTDELIEQAAEAKLREQISKAELAHYKVEKESLALKKAAGDVMETSFGEFLYFGYMERVNLDLLRMMKRVEPMIENMVNDHNTKGIIKRINSEITNILKGIQKQQSEDAKEWKKEL